MYPGQSHQSGPPSHLQCVAYFLSIAYLPFTARLFLPLSLKSHSSQTSHNTPAKLIVILLLQKGICTCLSAPLCCSVPLPRPSSAPFTLLTLKSLKSHCLADSILILADE